VVDGPLSTELRVRGCKKRLGRVTKDLRDLPVQLLPKLPVSLLLFALCHSATSLPLDLVERPAEFLSPACANSTGR